MCLIVCVIVDVGNDGAALRISGWRRLLQVRMVGLHRGS